MAPDAQRFIRFALQRVRQIHRPVSRRQILFMIRLHPPELVLEQRNQGRGQGCEPVFLTFPRAHRYLLHLKVHILHSQAHGLQDSQPAAVEQLDDEFSSIEVGALGVDRVVVEPQNVTDLMQ